MNSPALRNHFAGMENAFDSSEYANTEYVVIGNVKRCACCCEGLSPPFRNCLSSQHLRPFSSSFSSSSSSSSLSSILYFSRDHRAIRNVFTLAAECACNWLCFHAFGIGETREPAADIDKPSEQGQMNHNDLGQLILTVDYSDAALTAILVFEECNIFEYRRVLHDMRLGASTLSTTPENGQNDLVHALRNITALPLEDGNGVELIHISEVVLLGERADDRRLHKALEEVLFRDKRNARSDIAGRGNDRITNHVGPLFAASRGVAYDC